MEQNIDSQLLSEYNKIDNKNTNGNTLVKIFVGYIKPSFLFKSDILTPIHLGRAVAKASSKDGVINETDYQWLIKNCIGDNDFEENISHVNRRVGFLTGTYWAWKNYEKISNPEYFGFFGYRRLFSANCMTNLQSYDLVIPPKHFDQQVSNTKERYIQRYGSLKLYNATLDILKNLHPEDAKGFEAYLNLDFEYPHEIYIMKKQIFFDFCSWIFPILFEILKKDPADFADELEQTSPSHTLLKIIGEKRDLAHMMEKLTGYYLYKLTKTDGIKFCHAELFEIQQELTQQRANTCIISELRKRHLKND